jgi:hypothetical protein
MNHVLSNILIFGGLCILIVEALACLLVLLVNPMWMVHGKAFLRNWICRWALVAVCVGAFMKWQL